MTEPGSPTPRRRREPLRAAPLPAEGSSAASEIPDAIDVAVAAVGPARRPRRGVFSNVGRVVGVVSAVGREVAENTREVSQEVIGAAAARKPARDIAGTVLNGWINGAVRAASVIQDETGIEVASGAASALMDVDADGNGNHSRGSGIAKAAAHLVEQVSQAAESAVGVAGGAASEASHLMDHSFGTAVEMREELRRRGRDLLRRSTQLDDPDEHPAFRGIIREMAPDEARIVCYLAKAGPQPVVSLLEIDKMKKSTREIARNVSFVGLESGCLRPGMTPVYLDNLARLGVVFLRDFKTGAQEQYDVLYAQPEIDEVPAPTGRFVKHQTVDRAVELSSFGRSLYEMCFIERATDAVATADPSTD